MFWKIIGNWRKVASLIALVQKNYADKKLTKAEIKEINEGILSLLVELGLIEE